ncbi:MAG: hypothetical protein EHM50_07945, partial [Lysobacterales bacterium]
MNTTRILALAASAAVLAACESGDINLQPTNVDNSTTTGGSGGGGSTNPCASYTTSGGAVRQGVFEDPNCTYPPTFVSFVNPLRVDLDIPAL